MVGLNRPQYGQPITKDEGIAHFCRRKFQILDTGNCTSEFVFEAHDPHRVERIEESHSPPIIPMIKYWLSSWSAVCPNSLVGFPTRNREQLVRRIGNGLVPSPSMLECLSHLVTPGIPKGLILESSWSMRSTASSAWWALVVIVVKLRRGSP